MKTYFGNLNWLFALLALGALAIGFFYLEPFFIIIHSAIIISIAILIFYSAAYAGKATADLKTEKQRLGEIVENLSDGIFVYDENFKILVFNRAAEQIFGVNRNEILGQPFTLKVKQEPSPRLRPILVILFPALAASIIRRSEPGSYPQVADISFDDPPLELRVSTYRILGENGNAAGFIKIVHDRTREITLLRSKSEFITVASHQLRTPLTGLSWAMESLKKEPFTPAQRELVESAAGAIARLMRITNELLDVAKIEEGKFGYQFQPVDLVGFLEEALRQSKGVADLYKVKLYLEKPSGAVPKVHVDPQKLGLVVQNLIDNAIRYNIPNGEVVVKVEAVPGKPYLEISVRDTGIGIAPEDMKKLFSEFFRGANAVRIAVEGTGLGLYIAKNIVRRHGGTIRAESTLNRGSRFAFTLPTHLSLVPSKETVYGEDV